MDLPDQLAQAIDGRRGTQGRRKVTNTLWRQIPPPKLQEQGHLLRIKTRSDKRGRISPDNRIRLDIAHNDSPCGNDRSRSDGDTRKDGCPCADPHIVSDHNITPGRRMTRNLFTAKFGAMDVAKRVSGRPVRPVISAQKDGRAIGNRTEPPDPKVCPFTPFPDRQAVSPVGESANRLLAFADWASPVDGRIRSGCPARPPPPQGLLSHFSGNFCL